MIVLFKLMLPPVSSAVFAPNVVAVPSVIAPMLVAEPMVNNPVVIVFSSVWDSSRVLAVLLSTVLPILMALVAVVFCRVIAPVPALIVPPARLILSDVSVIVPLLLLIVPLVWVNSVFAAVSASVMLPPAAVLLMLVAVNAALLVNLILPLPVLVAAKLPTVFAEFSVVPPTEIVVSNPLVLIDAA